METFLVREFDEWNDREFIYECEDTEEAREELIAAEEGMRAFDRDIVNIVRMELKHIYFADILIQ